MCGVFGHAGDKKIDTDRCVAALAHRGPDDTGVYKDAAVELGHRRLSIIDISSRGHQPMTSVSGKSVIIFNGEIYNYKELQQSLAREGAVFASGSDTEVILEGYERHGTAFFERMRGMWAFALYDMEHKSVVLARDPFGIKPLYYAVQDKQLYFASELKCFRTAGIELKPNSKGYAAYYTLGYFIAPMTPYEDVYKMRPGEVLTWSIERKALNKEKAVSCFIEGGYNAPASYDEAVKGLDKTLANSIEAHYVADVPVSILLSGGTDSSVIAALSHKLGKRPDAYHVAIAGSEDTQYARRVAAELGLSLTTEELTQEALTAQYEKVWDVLDEPTGDISVIPTSLIYERIKGRSKVVLSGEGGDELFGGYLRHAMLARHTHVAARNSLNSFFNALLSPGHVGISYSNPLVQRMRTWALTHGIANDLVGAYLKSVRLADYPLYDNTIRDVLASSFKESEGVHVPPSLALDALVYLPNDLLYKSDISSMASSIEARVPFVDRYVWGYVSGMYASIGTSAAAAKKKILKDVLRRYLPRELVFRNKKGFGVPMRSYNSTAFEADFQKAGEYHLAHKEELGVSGDMAKMLSTQSSRNVICRKYPRFAFALISNWKFCTKS